MCREQLHILSFSGDNVCRVRQNVLLKVHILSPATNCAGATKCAVTDVFRSESSNLVAQKSVFGWIMSGCTRGSNSDGISLLNVGII